ncbi:MAG: hypothetical protein GY708_15970 [Actinomycetia bacterium]|nr:hypothetical protein [Actinomycetes bacterium]MCP4960761.1 hypothetical protein [Actinomycetes bacterium]
MVAFLRKLRAGSKRTADEGPETSPRPSDKMTRATKRLRTMRGDHITPGPADPSPSSIDNVTAAAKDYGLSRFSGETDALGGAAKGYRKAK